MNSYNSSLTNTYSDRHPALLSRSEHTAINKENRPISEFVREGQQLRGEIINRTTTDVTIRLPNGQTLQARLDVSVPLSIGQTASFEVTHADPALISLRILQDETSFAQNALIQKALTAAELPVTSRNVELVHTLLQHNLPISKESILSLVRQSTAYPNADINTLALLAQHKLPVTPAILTQFEAYQNYEHQILPQLENLAHSLVELTVAPNASFSGLTQIIQRFFAPAESTASEPIPSIVPLPSGEPLFESLMQRPLHAVGNRSAEITGTPEPLTNTTQHQPAATSLPLTQPPLHSAENRSAEVAGTPDLPAHTTQHHAATTSLPLTQPPLHPVETMPAEIAGTPEPPTNTTQNNSVTASHSLIQSTLSSAESILTETAANIHALETAGTAEPLFRIAPAQTATEPSPQGPAQSNLFPSPSVATEVRQDTFVQQLLTRWTLSPKDLTNPDKVKEFYHRLRQDLTELHNNFTTEGFSSHDKKIPGSSPEHLLSDTASAVERLQDNLEFMNMLNRIFPYVQLPIRFSDKTTHGELYVYTKKEKLRHESDSVSVLLHLDMEALGPTDIHLSLTQNRLTSRFYLNNPELKALFSEYLPELKETLASKGFNTDFELISRSQTEDPVRTFLSSHDSSGLSRFTFDCRA